MNTVHLLPYFGSQPLCNFTEEKDTEKCPEGHGFKRVNDADVYRDLNDFLNQISCQVCKEKFLEQRKKMPL